MTTDRQNRANRRNAQASTGPRTAEGKASSRQNARKYGLFSAAWQSESQDKIQQITIALAGEYANALDVFSAARRVAEADLHLNRVRVIKSDLLQNIFAVPNDLHDSAHTKKTETHLSESPRLYVLMRKVETLERYEQRAFSRRKTALRLLVANIEFIDENSQALALTAPYI